MLILWVVSRRAGACSGLCVLGLGSVLGFGGAGVDLVAYCGVGGAGCAVVSYGGSSFAVLCGVVFFAVYRYCG